MNGIQKGKSRNLKEPFPGCLGRMVNLFDLNIGVPGNKLLTENPYQDGKFLIFFQNLCFLIVECSKHERMLFIIIFPKRIL